MHSQDSSPENVEKPVEMNSTGDSWVWFPSWLDLKTHYLRELGFLASLAQFCGATIFWVSGVLPSSKVGVWLTSIRYLALPPFLASTTRCRRVCWMASTGFHKWLEDQVLSSQACCTCWKLNLNGIYLPGKSLDGILHSGIS